MAKTKFRNPLKASLRYFRSIDLFLALAVTVISLFGLAAIRSATLTEASGRSLLVQTVGLGAGLVIMIIISLIDYELLCDLWIPIIILSAGINLLTAIVAEEIDGNRAWLNLGFFNLQPSEFTKMAFAISFSHHLEKVGKEINRPRNILFLFIHFFAYVVPVVLQKDIGSALIYLGTFCILIYIAGVKYRYIALAGVLTVLATPLVWQYLSTYQKARIIYTFQPELDPLGFGYQSLMARLATGSGQLTGVGYGQGIQTQNDQLPADRTDFIFSVVGEELGFLGCMFVILMLIIIIGLIVKDAFKAKTKSGAYICLTIAAIIALQTAVNIGMCIGVSPVIGVTLPFMSHGGSSIMSLFVGMGLVQSVNKKPEKALNFKINNE